VNEPFELFLDITRKGENKDKDKKEFTKPIEVVALDEKGNLLEDKKAPLKQAGSSTNTITLLASKHSKEPWRTRKEQKPTFKAGNPPNAQIEFELDAATLAEMAGVRLGGEDFGNPPRAGFLPDDATDLQFRARIPKDDRELMDEAEHRSEAEK